MNVVRTFPNPAAAADVSITIPSNAGTAISCTTNGTTTLTSTAAFGNVFPGMQISGTGIPQGTTVASIASASSLTMSAAATDSTTGNRTFSHIRERWRLRAAHVKLVTDINVANRIVKLLIDDGTNTVHVSFNDVAQTASLTSDYSYSPDSSGDSAAATTSIARIAAIPDLILGPGWRIRTVTAAKQAGDQFSEIVLCVEEVGWQA